MFNREISYHAIFILIKRWLLQKIVNFNFAIFESQVKKIFKVELCIHVTFVHKIRISLFVITKKKFANFVNFSSVLNSGQRELIDCRTNSCSYGKSCKYLDRPR